MSEPDCSDALREIYGFLDGELTADVRARISQHLDDCAHCLEAFDFEAELKMVVARKCIDAPPAGLQDRIARALREASPPAG